MKQFPWVAFTGAILVYVVMLILWTVDDNFVMVLVFVPPLLLLAGGWRGFRDRRYVLACVALGVVLSIIQLIMIWGMNAQHSLPSLIHIVFVNIMAMTWITNSLTGIAIGIVSVASAMRGHVERWIGLAGGVIGLVGATLGMLIIRALMGFSG